jgi:hypothetical protein
MTPSTRKCVKFPPLPFAEHAFFRTPPHATTVSTTNHQWLAHCGASCFYPQWAGRAMPLALGFVIHSLRQDFHPRRVPLMGRAFGVLNFALSLQRGKRRRRICRRTAEEERRERVGDLREREGCNGKPGLCENGYKWWCLVRLSAEAWTWTTKGFVKIPTMLLEACYNTATNGSVQNQ